MSDGQQVVQAARDAGAEAVGIAGHERLSGPPSFDPRYLLPGARAVVSVMVSFDGQVVMDYLSRQDPQARQRMQAHEVSLYRRLHHIAGQVTSTLEKLGYSASFDEPNLDYRYKRSRANRAIPTTLRQRFIDWMAERGGQPLKRALVARLPDSLLSGGSWRLTPTLSHRYAALAAGTGVMGWSGNVLHPDHGARVLYHSVVTDAPLQSTPLSSQDLCSSCRLCSWVCQGGFIHARRQETVSVGGRTHTHNRKAHNLRCIFVCGGLTGQNRHPGWSTWCEGRIKLADDDEDLARQWIQVARRSLGLGDHTARALADLSYLSEYGYIRNPEDRFAPTCGNCQHVCAGSREERVRLYRLILGRDV
jgi:epoxyqueuosine reductase QueG